MGMYRYTTPHNDEIFFGIWEYAFDTDIFAECLYYLSWRGWGRYNPIGVGDDKVD